MDDIQPEKKNAASETITQDSLQNANGLITTDKAKLDVAAEFLVIHEQQYGDYTKEEATRVRWKIDLRLVPMLFVTQTLCAIDKILISNAALYGMKTDTHLTGKEYSWVGSIFFFGYLIAEFPSNALIQKLPVGKLAAISCMGWASTTMLLGACNNAAGLMVVRFIMGAFEAPIVPALSIMTVMWYMKREQPVRVAIWYSGFSSLFTGIISYGVGHSHSAITSWRLLFLVLGSFTFVWGLFIFFFLPDSPLNARFLSEREKFIAVHRVRGNKTGIENKTIKWYQVKEAFMDFRTYPPAIFAITVNFINGATGVFAAQIVSSFGYGPLQTVLLGMPTGMFMTFSALCVAIPNMWLRNMRVKISSVFMLVPLVAALLVRRK
ncbi:hypothetical protein LTR99_000065 [Exophiala xenobiotica]|uniref:Major facilitator superfamily (MFS) profile domain-containing protein n=1 Tax=Vermiconidia calcicola TaxID=1690605 RepID=A0AAV9PXD3_9PEZI|nr:hypothetical protein LTR92_009204 [Exophiala xenobiotica]KAK5530124.1 hypothetical protein LTR25_009370 [Vermiconidia calcicola]KAK5547444.1 hypothetical protein LTR23_002666 [Chaetothyriales sp. CCFEE 6169]KAK5265341.1 hypothetical protein LTR96_009243 [Exophiala xenobiotica]KAK5307097.1 hypothetical protein LTR99_000065 [Exophiala xenobiotica]